MLTISPNPFKDVININFSKPTDLNPPNVTVKLFYLIGNIMVLTNIEFIDDGNGNFISDNTGNLTVGNYVIQVTVAGVTKTAIIMSENE